MFDIRIEVLPRWCIVHKGVFGCVGFDGKPWTCAECPFLEKCTMRVIIPNLEDVTSGLCKACLEVVLAKSRERKAQICA